MFSSKITIHIKTQYPSFEFLFGELKPTYNLANYANELKPKLKCSMEKAKMFLNMAKEARETNSLLQSK